MKRIMSLLVAMMLVIGSLGIVANAAPAGSKVPAASEWQAQGTKITVTDVTEGTKFSMEETVFGTDLVATKSKYKLDGLYIHMVDIRTTAGNKNINLSVSKDQYDLSKNSILFLANTYGAAIYKYVGTTDSPFGKSITPVFSNPNQGLSLLFVKADDGSFNVLLAGTATDILHISKADIEDIFGSDDPDVYVNFNDNWHGHGAAVGNSCIIRELSTGNNPAFTSYCDPWGRDIYSTQETPLTNITLNHFGNHGAFSFVTSKMPVDGLTLKGVTIDFSAMFRFGSSLGVTTDDGFSGEGILVRVDKDGSVFATLTAGVGPDNIIGTFTNIEPFTVQVVKQLDNSYKVFVIGDTSGEIFEYAISEDFMEAMYGEDANPSAYISYTSYDNSANPMKIVTIESVFNETNFDAIKPENASATLSGKKITAAADSADDMIYTYQWFSSNTDQASGGTKISGATGADYTIPGGLAEGDYYYYCEITATSFFSGATDTTTTNAVKFASEGEEDPDPTTPPVEDDEDNPTTGNSLPISATILSLIIVAYTILKKRRYNAN